MKVVDFADADQRLGRRTSAIRQQIRDIQSKLPPTSGISVFLSTLSATERQDLPVLERHKFLVSISKMANFALESLLLSAEAQKARDLRNAGFASFPRLPTELRLKIWRFAMQFELMPRVHCIDRKQGRFVSNQGISPLLGICHESRTQYIEATESLGGAFAFETYINFNTDIVYISFFKGRDYFEYPPDEARTDTAAAEAFAFLEDEIEDANHVDENGSLDHDDPNFVAFLEDPSSAKIQNLAMRTEFEKHLPLTGHMSSTHAQMRICMPEWSKAYIVFEDYRQKRTKWLDTNANFKKLSARQIRKRAERGFARQHAKVLNRMIGIMEGIEVEDLEYLFCFVEPGNEVAFIKRRYGLKG